VLDNFILKASYFFCFLVNFTQLGAKEAEEWLGEFSLYRIRATYIHSLITAYLFWLRLMPSSIGG